MSRLGEWQAWDDRTEWRTVRRLVEGSDVMRSLAYAKMLALGVARKVSAQLDARSTDDLHLRQAMVGLLSFHLCYVGIFKTVYKR